MAFDDSPPPREYTPSKDDTAIVLPSPQPSTTRIRLESSEEDMPIMLQRKSLKRAGSVLPRERERRSHEEPKYRERRASSPKADSKLLFNKNGKPYKRPGPQPWASKPIMKNDMVAKKAVIREIESYWGKSFIRSYIPKCHRPLVKRGADGKRPAYRAHETNPKKWLPSVLKAILMIAKLTKDKKWLKDAMNDVVRYRIKNTGNRKPQLVTTDFDVIEDMLVKDWAVDYAFEIRYKHLLVNRKDQQETDEDIDHILQVANDDGDEEGDESEEENEDDMDGRNEGVNHDNDDDEGIEHGYGGISNRYQCSSGYIKDDQHTLAPTPHQQAEQEKLSRNSRIVSTPDSPGPMKRAGREKTSYRYGSPAPGCDSLLMSPWGTTIPTPYGGYGGFHGYGGFPGYGQPQLSSRDSNQGPRHPKPYGMYPPLHHMSPMPGNSYRPSSFGSNTMGHEGHGLYGSDRRSQALSGVRQGSMHPKIKRESPDYDDPIMSVGEISGPQTDLGAVMNQEDEDLDGELEVAELELKLARLRAKKAAQKKAR
ncbi:hypothetical protein IAQ61_001367 [Plenodomus lingam]|uniref:uncharacterized protein n=1 Tax=Leptosphaeria maculans TaxID=5022 RepID=UPI003331870B|nr:hypothetical protein IAQ61_001367 [Plenodomus lingam]